MKSATINLEKTGQDSLMVGETTLKTVPESKSGSANHTPLVSLDEICRIHVRRVLVSCDGNRKWAAQILGIGRTTLYRRYLKSADLTER